MPSCRRPYQACVGQWHSTSQRLARGDEACEHRDRMHMSNKPAWRWKPRVPPCDWPAATPHAVRQVQRGIAAIKSRLRGVAVRICSKSTHRPDPRPAPDQTPLSLSSSKLGPPAPGNPSQPHLGGPVRFCNGLPRGKVSRVCVDQIRKGLGAPRRGCALSESRVAETAGESSDIRSEGVDFLDRGGRLGLGVVDRKNDTDQTRPQTRPGPDRPQRQQLAQ